MNEAVQHTAREEHDPGDVQGKIDGVRAEAQPEEADAILAQVAGVPRRAADMVRALEGGTAKFANGFACLRKELMA